MLSACGSAWLLLRVHGVGMWVAWLILQVHGVGIWVGMVDSMSAWCGLAWLFL